MMPDAKPQLKRFPLVCRNEMIENCLVELQRSVRRHMADPAYFSTILEKLVVGENGRQKDGPLHCGRRRLYAESIPREAIQVGITLFCPWSVGAEKRPRGVVETCRRPAGIVT